MTSAKDYDYISWKEAIQDCEDLGVQVSLSNLKIHESWQSVFDSLEDVLQIITRRIVSDTKQGKIIFPYPELLFKAFQTPLDSVKVVILGQDPYHGLDSYYGDPVPQAMGLSFSVPTGIKTPSSLQNIYKNLVKFGHLKSVPTHGNLEKLQPQGVMFLNAALSVVKATPKSHQDLWEDFTVKIIQALDSKDVTFVLWGGPAIAMGANLKYSPKICSSHPSGYSWQNPCGSNPAFIECDFAKDLDVDWNVLIEQ